MMVVDLDTIKTLQENLERQELFDAPGGILSPVAYGQLLAIYLLQKDLCNAKYLWKRIPQNLKNTNPELHSIWKVGQKIWQRDWPNIYMALRTEWSENVQHIMTLVEETIRNRAIGLVSHAYSTVSIDDLCSFLGLPADQALRLVSEQGWTVDMATRMVVPKLPEPSTDRTASNDEQLYKLTEFVSFLEN